MTKSPHSVTRLRLFELYRLLALLCVFKLCLFGVLLIDVDWGNFHEAVKTVAENGIQLDDDAGVKEETPSEAADADAASEDAVPQALAEATGGGLSVRVCGRVPDGVRAALSSDADVVVVFGSHAQ